MGIAEWLPPPPVLVLPVRTPLSAQGDHLTPAAAAEAVLPVLTPGGGGSRNPKERSPIASPPLLLSPRGAFRDAGPRPVPGSHSRWRGDGAHREQPHCPGREGSGL